MAIEKSTINHEILIRFNADGTVGSHLQTITGFVEDGQFIQAPQLDVPLTLSLEDLRQFVLALKEEDWYKPVQETATEE